MCEQTRLDGENADAHLPSRTQKRHQINLHPVSGLRAIACLGVVMGHCMFWVAGSAADKMQVYQLLDKHAWMTGLMKMPQVFMDTFLVLTGFLAAQSLVPGLAAAPGYIAYLRKYYTSRFTRIAPSLYSILAIVYLVVLPAIGADLISADARRAFAEVDPFNPGNCQRLLWASFAFVNNMFPFAGCASHTWSTAVQMQFFVLFPLCLILLRPRSPDFRSRVGYVAACITAAVLGHRAYVMNKIQLWTLIPVPFYGPFTAETQAKMYYMWSASYLSLASHLGSMSLGVLAYLGLSSPNFVTWLGRHQGKTVAAAILLSALIIADCCTNSYGPTPDPEHPAANPAVLTVGFVLVTGLLQPLLPACYLVLACAGLGGPSAWLAKGLSDRVLKWVADVSYDVYLLHPILIMGVWTLLPPSGWFDPVSPVPFLAVAWFVCNLSLGTGYLHGLLVRRVMQIFTSTHVNGAKAH